MHSVRSRVSVTAFVVAVALTLILSAPASATPTKPYALAIQPAAVPAGTGNVLMTATLTNENKLGSGINVGSVNLTPPVDFNVTSASVQGVARFVCPGSCRAAVVGNVVQLRGLAVPPGSAVQVSMHVSTRAQAASAPFVCTVAAPCGWSVLAKQSNDFSGPPGNNLTLDTATSALNTVLGQLRFGAQPHSVGVGEQITDSDYNPSPPGGTGGPVTVQVVDATNLAVVTAYSGVITLTLTTPANAFTNPFPATLGGTKQIPSGGVAQNVSAGVATFSDLTVDQAGNGYTLSAASGDTPSLTAVSNSFAVQQAGAQCTTNQSCHTEAKSANNATTNGGVDGAITASSGQSTDLAESLDFGAHMSAKQCEGYDAPHDVYWNLDPASARIVQLSITTTVLTGNITGSMIYDQDNCLAAPNEFTEENESTNPSSLSPAPPATQPDGSPGFSGLLPDCGDNKGQVSIASNPCVVSRTGSSSPLGGGTLTITISVPASLGDMTSRG